MAALSELQAVTMGPGDTLPDLPPFGDSEDNNNNDDVTSPTKMDVDGEPNGEEDKGSENDEQEDEEEEEEDKYRAPIVDGRNVSDVNTRINFSCNCLGLL